MKGCRALTKTEIRKTVRAFAGKYRLRDRALFLLGLHTGFRITELLSLRVCDVVADGRMLDRVVVRRANVKGKVEGRSVVFHPTAQRAVLVWLRELQRLGYLTKDTFLFQSRARGNRPITGARAWSAYMAAFQRAGVAGQLGTHSTRKTFAKHVYETTGRDFFRTQQALGHKDPKSTTAYLTVDQDEIDRAILAAGGAEST